MAQFKTSLDIANRACDHCGAATIDATLGFNEDSRQAEIFGRIYDKKRQAELEQNSWRFAIKKAAMRPIDTTTMLLAPALWLSTVTYFVGHIVADADGQVWISNSPSNTGNEPRTSRAWDEYFGPLTVSPYDSTQTYWTGELVYTDAGDGTNRVYQSLISSNADNPATATAWAATTTYKKNDVVTYLSVAYMSLIDLNLNQTPTSSAANWASGTTYAINALVNGSDGVTYKSLGNGNVGHDPTTDAGVNWLNTGVLTAWTTVFTGGSGSVNWRQIGGAEFPNGVTLTTLNLIYPIGSGPWSQTSTANVFRLPANHLRRAPQNPKAGSVSALGAPGNDIYDDWLFENDYLISLTSTPLIYRFVADTTDVTKMDSLFCEGLAASMAFDGCEAITQSSEKVKTIAGKYKKAIDDAKIKNAIEIGSEEPALDDWIACRA